MFLLVCVTANATEPQPTYGLETAPQPVTVAPTFGLGQDVICVNGVCVDKTFGMEIVSAETVPVVAGPVVSSPVYQAVTEWQTVSTQAVTVQTVATCSVCGRVLTGNNSRAGFRKRYRQVVSQARYPVLAGLFPRWARRVQARR